MEPGRQLAVLALALLAGALPAGAKVLQTQAEALAAAFPGRTVERKTAYLDDAQAAAVEKEARAKLDTHVVPYYVARSTDGKDGYAYFDTHTVRTMPETVMVVVGHDARVLGVEVLDFQEPDDYLPRPRWRQQFVGKSVQDPLWIKRDIRNVTGATLTAQAVAEAVRRTLALHKVLHP